MRNTIDDLVAYDAAENRKKPDAPQGTGNLEVEVKFLVDDFAVLRERLIALGAVLVSPRTYERNLRFDTSDEDLLARWQLLRLRKDKRARLTFKGPAGEDETSEAKVREEIEVVVDNFDKMILILERLGFSPVQEYEKYRETYHLSGVEIVMDETPFGLFVELEGDESGIRAIATRLGLDWTRRVLANYLALMELARRTFDLPFADLTFENFELRPVSLSGLLPLCVLAGEESS